MVVVDPPIIEIAGLTKTYRSGAAEPVCAVDALSLSVAKGTVFAFLGRNGAGKTTTMSCINTTLAFDSGRVVVGGFERGRDDDAIRRQIGVVFQSSILDPLLTARENLRLRAALYGTASGAIDRIPDLMTLVGIEQFADQRYGSLSGGQQRRVDIARALLHNPTVLMLDEPTAGLDPASREQVWQTVHSMQAEYGLTVFLTTHYMQETEQADQVCIIDHGSIVAEGTPAQLRNEYSRSVLTLLTSNEDALRAICDLRALPAVRDGERWRVEVPNATIAREVLTALGSHMRDFEFRHGTMDDVFLAVTDEEDHPHA